jgi:hypothetical protein
VRARDASKTRSTRISSSFVTVVSFIVQLTACLMSFAILASSALVSFFSAPVRFRDGERTAGLPAPTASRAPGRFRVPR